MGGFFYFLLFTSMGLWAPWPIYAVQPTGAHTITMRWLGTAGWEISVGGTVVLIAPFITRHIASAAQEWQTNEEEVLKIIHKADFIFAGHSHADHIADIPFIAKRFGAKVIGSRTTINIALTGGVDKSQLTTIRGGEKLEFQDFSVRVIESKHRLLTRGRSRDTQSKEILSPWPGPVKGDAFVEGGSYLYYFTFDRLRVLHQSSGNFIEENLTSLRPDIALLAENGSYDWPAALKILQPKTIVIHHYDQWRTPFSEGIPAANRRRAQRFQRAIKEFNPAIKVIIPDLLKTIEVQ